MRIEVPEQLACAFLGRQVGQVDGSCGLADAAVRKRDLFEQAFGCQVVVTAEA